MPRTYVPKSKRYTEEDLQTALTLIRQNKLTIRKAAAQFRIDKSKLCRSLNKQHATKRGRKSALSREEERNLTEKITVMAKWGFALTKEEVKEAVQTYVSENNIRTVFKDGKPGDDWFRSFCKRNRLSQKKMEQLEKCRRKATSDPFIIYGFYDLVDKTLKEFGLEDKPSHIFNLDESSFSMDPNRVKGVAAKGQKVHRNIEGSGKENITTMACISASGQLLPPLIIFQGQNLWSTWKGTNDLENTCYAASEKGWMTTVIFNSWFEKFCNIVPQRPLLVIMDGHITHLDVGTIELAMRNNITLLKLPPHTTDLLQPLDKCCFGPWKLKWNEQLIAWQRQNQRKLTKSEFADKICSLWHDGITKEAIQSSFQKTGIYPCDRTKYPKNRLDETKLQRYNEAIITPFDIFEQNEENLNDEEEINNDDEIRDEEEIYDEGNRNDEINSQTAANDRNGKENAVNLSESAIASENTNLATLSTSFENILLNKINKTTVVTKKRRKIDSGSVVLTSGEYLNLLKEKEDEKKKRRKRKRTRKFGQKWHRTKSNKEGSQCASKLNQTATREAMLDMFHLTMRVIWNV